MYLTKIALIWGLPVTMLLFRVVKQALKFSMGSLTQKHIEDVSMCALFLMEAAKKKRKLIGNFGAISLLHTLYEMLKRYQQAS